MCDLLIAPRQDRQLPKGEVGMSTDLILNNEVKPWIGEQWNTSDNRFGTRLLVLGESSHSAEDSIGSFPPNLITETVSGFLEGKYRPRFHTVLTTLLSGRDSSSEVSAEERQNIWRSLAFVNFVPGVAAMYSRERPTNKMFAAGANGLREFMRTYEPRAILVCGYNLWGWVNWGMISREGKPWEVPSPSLIGSAWAAKIKHPSTGFSYQRWRPCSTIC